MNINWNDIQTVLLDMDGTLLDRHFDDHFWLHHVPQTYARKHDLPLAAAKETLYSLFRSQERTLNWTDLDYWSSRLGIDIPALKIEVDHLIAIHPFVVEFLLFLHQQKKRIYLVTNAHGKTLDLKLKKTRIGGYFSGIISAHDLGLPKEETAFWSRLQQKIPYDPARTLLGEDSEANLESAAAYGIKYLVFVSRASSALPAEPSPNYASIHYFNELIPQDASLNITLPNLSPRSRCLDNRKIP